MELVCTAPFGCPNKNISHDTDALKELHGSMEKPIPVEETRNRKYVPWEYNEISRIAGLYHRCQQQLFEDRTKTPKVSVDRIVVRDIKGNHHVFYFDISKPINDDLVIMEQAWKDYQAGKPIDPERKKWLDKAMAFQKSGKRTMSFKTLTGDGK